MKTTDYFIDKIKEKQGKLNLKKTALSEISGINRMSIHNIFSKKTMPTLEQIYKLAQAVNLKLILVDTSIKTELPVHNLAKYIELETERLRLLTDMHGTLSIFLSAFNETKIHKKQKNQTTLNKIK